MNTPSPNNDADTEGTESARSAREFAVSYAKDEYTDDRRPWEWQSKYPPEAHAEIKLEAWVLAVLLLFLIFLSTFFLGLSDQSLDIRLAGSAAPETASTTASTKPLTFTVDFRFVAIFFVGAVGGVTFSIKWLVHAVATGRWHLDRRYWRLLIPGVAGVYACVVLILVDAGLIGGQPVEQPRAIALAAAFAFLVGYFSDGVSGLLSNIANAVFGTLEKK